MKLNFNELSTLYLQNLLDDCLPFWEKNSLDHEYGGYLTSLDREGNVFDTDKYIWLQGRQIWTFSMLYNRLEKRPEWLDIARHGAEFLRKHGMDAEGNFYFIVDRQGNPLVQPYNIFSDCFAAMAFSQYALASGDEAAKDLALSTFRNVWKRKDNPKGQYTKAVPGARPMKTLAIPMIISNLVLELEWLLDKEYVDQVVDTSVSEVMGVFRDAERGIMFENVSPDGSHPDCFDGRLINPGHGIECMWFIMDIARRKGDKKLIDDCVDTALSLLDFAWDKEYGGIHYFLDSEGRPIHQLEWDRKLWWVHQESLVTLAMGYWLTRREDCWEWYQKVHDYSWSKFPDPEFGEWWAYLDRQGNVLTNIKGGKWTGCFHLPRTLYLCHGIFSALETGAHTGISL